MSAIETLLTGLFDYAGLYPPAGLDLSAATRKYRQYAEGAQAWALGRLIVNLERVDDLRKLAGDGFGKLRLSAIAKEGADFNLPAEGMSPIETLEMKCNRGEDAGRIAARVAGKLPVFLEAGFDEDGEAALKAISAAGAKAKIRMGGLVPEAIPSIEDVARVLMLLAKLRLPFKATAGLHHPVRQQRALTYEAQSATGVMHGFLNLCCGAALAYFGGNEGEVAAVLDERDAGSFGLRQDSVHWRDRSWSDAELAEVREHFLISIGSCSFEEPMDDLKTMGWL